MFETVLANFGIDVLGEVYPIANGTANKNYIVKTKVGLTSQWNKLSHSDQMNKSSQLSQLSQLTQLAQSGQSDFATYVIRERSQKYSSEEQMLFEEEYLQHIFSEGIPAPVPLKALSGMCWYNYNEKVYQIYPFIDGGEFNCDNDKDVEEGGTFLGKLHSAVNGFIPKVKRTLPRYDDPSVIIREVSRTISENITAISFEEKEILDYILKQSEHLHEYFTDEVYHKLPKLLIHGDYHPANVKYMDGVICGLFDFDWVSLQPRLRDVADGIIYFASRRNQNITGNNIFSLASGYTLDIERSKKFINAYCRNVYIPLLKEEIKYIPYFIKARLMHSRVQALSKIPRHQAVKMLTEGMKPILLWIHENME